MQTILKEITTPTRLCNDQGRLNPDALGWSRRPLHICNLRGHFPRKKKWDYWCITGDKFLFSTTIAHVDYLALGSAYFLEYDSGRFAELNAARFLARGPEMPETVGGTIHYNYGEPTLAFDSHENGLVITARADNFNGKPLDAMIEIDRRPNHETLNVVVPWDETTFQFTSKQHCLSARGSIRWGDETFEFTNGSTFACLDYGRGIWPYSTSWNWASFSGRSGKDVVGLNMGAKWTDGTGMNENGILLNGRLSKVFDDVIFSYDDRDFMRPWKMKTENSNAIDLEFIPFYEKISNTNLFIIRSNVHQMFGHYRGVLRVDNKDIPIENIIGWAEEHHARW
jgi:hypothetical protein